MGNLPTGFLIALLGIARMLDKFRRPYLKLERAGAFIAELESEISEFLERKPYLVTYEHDPQDGTFGPIAYVNETIPEVWSCMIGDAIHNMRASFDLTINAIVAPSYFGKARMPIFAQADPQYIKGVPNIKGLDQSHFDKVVRLQPFNGGDENLRVVHDLDIIDKHCTLVVTSLASALQNISGSFGGGAISVGKIAIPTEKVGRYPLGFRVSSDIEMSLINPGRITTKIIFSEVGPVNEMEVIEALNSLFTSAHRFVKEFVPVV